MKLLLPKQLKSGHLIWVPFVTVLILVLLITVVGSATTHQGILSLQRKPNQAAEKAVTTSSRRYNYSGRISGNHNLFRGNDLFRVIDATTDIPEDQLLSQEWDTQHGKGRVLLSTVAPLPSEHAIPVAYSLTPRWDRLCAYLLQGFAVLLILHIVWARKNLSEVLHSRILIAPVSLVTVGAVASFFVAIIKNPGWIYGDTHYVLSSTVQGKTAFLPIFPSIGRFFPMAFVDWNLLIPFGNSPAAYHTERAVLLILTALLLLVTTRKIAGTSVACFLLITFLTTPGLFWIYGSPIFAEAPAALLLALFFCLYLSWHRNRKPIYLIGCGMVAVFLSYCKEPLSGMLATFALVQLIFGYRNLNVGGRIFSTFLLVNAAIFLGVYWWICKGDGPSYAEVRSLASGATPWSTLAILLSSHLIVPLIFGLAVVRAPGLLRIGNNRLLAFDAILYSGVAYVIALAILTMQQPYLPIPAYVAWIIALSGYIGHALTTCDNSGLAIKKEKTKSTPPIPSPIAAWATTGLIAFMLVSILLQWQSSIVMARQHHKSRSETKYFTSMFARISDQGFRMLVYSPNDMGLGTARFRTKVLNVFDSNFRGEDIIATEPFQAIETISSDIVADRCLLVVDRGPEHEAARNELMNRGFQPLTDAPLVMNCIVFVSYDLHDQLAQSFREQRFHFAKKFR